MSIRFSQVTPISNGKNMSFLVDGSPTCQSDLLGWTIYESLLHDTRRYHIVHARVQTFLYGSDEPFNATPEEVAYIYKRIDKQPDFIERRTEKIGEAEFIIINI